MSNHKTNNPYDQYKEIQIKTASQGKLIVMLYDGAIKFLNAAKEAIEQKKIEEGHNKITKAQDIIMELLLSLNFEAGDIAHKLYNLYIYMNKRLIEANIYKSTTQIDEVIKMLNDLKEVWNQIANQTGPGDEKSLDKNISVNITT